MTDLAQLIADLESAQVGSLHYDKRILAALGFTWRGMAYWSGQEQWNGSAALTRSIDAIVALIERKLPGQMSPLFHEAWAFVSRTHDLACRFWKVEVDGSYQRAIALALCIAFLRALQAQQETSEDG